MVYVWNSTIRLPHPKSGEIARGIFTRYVHVKPDLALGYLQEVKVGDTIGTIQKLSEGGVCSGDFTHVHFSMDLTRHDVGLHVNPNDFWVDGPGKVTCYRDGMSVPPDKIVAPLRCKSQ